ncbi:NAD(P)H-hydrate dehydratase [Bifidobacteriaceae bacterium NR044]|nr:NAD(P)H-hydrate dehydratase [Bifidobacteriaceae bacterium NR043]MBF9353394.1 NAD(P)H-hydrate dehydratase [Bifidobacteriaceae bacterium NR044]
MSSLVNLATKDASKCLKIPDQSSNKYSRGVLGVITGSNEYPGAAVLSTRAAAYSNIGMVRYSGPLRAQNLVLQASPEVVASQNLQGKVDAITVGSGIPDAEHCNSESAQEQREQIANILKNYENESQSSNIQSQSQSALPPICVDAGALDLLPKKVCAKVVLTPHAGELCSLFKRYDLEISAQEILQNPVEYAQKAADLTGATVLVKGAKTVVASASYTHTPIYIAQYGPTWLATAGSGDVLAGILGALLAQREKKDENRTNYAFIAASAAIIHGICAVFASRSSGGNSYTQLVQDMLKAKKPLALEHPIVASDIISALPHVLGILINMK